MFKLVDKKIFTILHSNIWLSGPIQQKGYTYKQEQIRPSKQLSLTHIGLDKQKKIT